MVTLSLRLRHYVRRASRLAVPVVVGALVGCGASEGPARAVPGGPARAVAEAQIRAVPDEPTRIVPVAAGMPAAGARPIAVTNVPPVAAPIPPKDTPAPFRLVGTSISASSAFAFLKEADQGLLTVHEGDKVDGYTIAAIAPDRVKLRSDNAEQLLMLVAATGDAAAATTRTDGVAPAPTASTGLVDERINTDQSIPEHVTFGPTGSLPEGVRQVGH